MPTRIRILLPFSVSPRQDKRDAVAGQATFAPDRGNFLPVRRSTIGDCSVVRLGGKRDGKVSISSLSPPSDQFAGGGKGLGVELAGTGGGMVGAVDKVSLGALATRAPQVAVGRLTARHVCVILGLCCVFAVRSAWPSGPDGRSIRLRSKYLGG